jgi:hypothetical protein
MGRLYLPQMRRTSRAWLFDDPANVAVAPRRSTPIVIACNIFSCPLRGVQLANLDIWEQFLLAASPSWTRPFVAFRLSRPPVLWMIIVVDLLGTASANLRPTQTQYFCLNSGAEISRQRSFIHPARRSSHHLHASYTLLALGPIHRICSGSSSAAQTAVRLHLPGTTVGSTPCGSRQPLSGDLFKNLQRTL